MGFSVATSPSSSTLFADVTLAEAQAQEGAQENALENGGSTLPQELANGKMEGQRASQGMLKGESKPFLFTKEASQILPQKLHDYLSDINRPQQDKLLDAKNQSSNSSFKKSDIKIKEFKISKIDSQNPEGKQAKQEASLSTKSHQLASRALEKGRAPQSAAQVREATLAKQHHQTQARTLQNRIHNDYISKGKHPAETGSRKNELKDATRLNKKESERAHQEASTRDLEKKEEKEQHRQREKSFDKEEGSSGGQEQHGHQEDDQKREDEKKLQKIDATYIQKFADYAAEESILSEIFQMKISQFDILVLFMEILKLEIKGREQERISRQEERRLQILHMEKVVENYKTQSTWTMNTSIGAGILGIISGAAPIIGHMKGDWLIENLGAFFESIRDAKKDQLFKGIHKITNTMSEMQKSVGQIHQTFSDGNRTYDQHMSDLYRSDHEERTRTIDEIKDSWKGIENFLYQTLQMHHDAIRQLYSR